MSELNLRNLRVLRMLEVAGAYLPWVPPKNQVEAQELAELIGC